MIHNSIDMPELPEVETIRRGLENYLVGHTIEDVELRLKKQFQGDTKDIIGAQVTDVKRFGKGLVIELSNGYALAIHIKLTGQLVYTNKELRIKHNASREFPNKWTRIIFHLDKEATLYYNDLRQFGWVKVIKTADLKTLPFFKELGPEFPVPKEPLGEDKLTMEQFTNILSKSSTAVKVLIMDQKKMAGIGNIYANDALYLAGIDPRRPAKSLSKGEAEKFYESIEEVLKKGLEYGGSSELTYVNALGQEGRYQEHTLIYGKQGTKCSRDGGKIEKFMLGGRGTYMCPICQK